MGCGCGHENWKGMSMQLGVQWKSAWEHSCRRRAGESTWQVRTGTGPGGCCRMTHCSRQVRPLKYIITCFHMLGLFKNPLYMESAYLQRLGNPARCGQDRASSVRFKRLFSHDWERHRQDPDTSSKSKSQDKAPEPSGGKQIQVTSINQTARGPFKVDGEAGNTFISWSTGRTNGLPMVTQTLWAGFLTPILAHSLLKHGSIEVAVLKWGNVSLLVSLQLLGSLLKRAREGWLVT